MIIEFTKVIVGKDALGEFCIQQEAVPHKNGNKAFNAWEYRVNYTYHLSELNASLIEGLESVLKERHYATFKYADDKLWISEPDQFSVNLLTNSYTPGYYEDDAWKKIEIAEDHQTLRTVTMPLKKIITRDADVYTFEPKVTVNGRICYALTGKIDPIPLLQTLQTMGYTAEITSIPKEITEALKSGQSKKY
jgi:hypothetical protein